MRKNVKIAIGVLVLVGVVLSLGFVGYQYWGNSPSMLFEFEDSSLSPPDLFFLNIRLEAGPVDIQFVDDAALLYRLIIRVSPYAFQRHGAPVPTSSSDSFELIYPMLSSSLDLDLASVSLTLGSGTNYSMFVHTDLGLIRCVCDHNAHLSDILLLHNGNGGIQLLVTDEASIPGNLTIDLEAHTGNIDLNVELPGTMEGRFAATSTEANVIMVEAHGEWSGVGDYQYETPNYDIAASILLIEADNHFGTISAVLQ